jgi:hypothetical protein
MSQYLERNSFILWSYWVRISDNEVSVDFISPYIKSKLSTSSKLLVYKTTLKQILTYGIQLWGTASTCNTEIRERFQSKALRMIVDAPWYVPNTVIGKDLQIPTVKEEIRRYSSQHNARLSAHPNDLVVNFMEQPGNNRRLRRNLPNELPTRFFVLLSYL